jgi:hypothetical protein
MRASVESQSIRAMMIFIEDMIASCNLLLVIGLTRCFKQYLISPGGFWSGIDRDDALVGLTHCVTF